MFHCIFTIFISIFFSFLALANSDGTCPRDKALISDGWVQHSPDELETVWNQKSLDSNGQDYAPDMEAIYHSAEINDFVHFQSFDNTVTPQLEMYGDIAIYKHYKTNERLEIRWYADGKKHFVHKKDLCTVDVVPMAENSLF